MTRRIGWLTSMAVCAVLAALGFGAAGGARGQPPEPTPPIITEPTVAPRPVFLPRLLKRYDPLAPDPPVTLLEGYVVKLTAEGRASCSPATHLVQDKPEGYPNATAQALLYSPHPEPELNLDLFVGEYVETFGFGSLAPEACAKLSWQLLAVESIRRKEILPGHHH
jgi:hypothetical protein